jgi:hypothetical protein
VDGSANTIDVLDDSRLSILTEQLREGELVPFLGAGASVFQWANGIPCPPSGTMLAEKLAERCRFPVRDDAQYLKRDLARVASYFQHVFFDRMSLYRELRKEFEPEFPPNKLHTFLAQAAGQQNMLLITTNYDDMIERAFQAAGRLYHLIVTVVDDPANAGAVLYCPPNEKQLKPVDPRKLDRELNPILCPGPDEDHALDDDVKASVIYKIHGSMVRARKASDSYLITEEDYIRFLGDLRIRSPVPDSVLAALKRKRLLFLGYSLRDWNFRVLLQMLSEERNDIKDWAIALNPDPVESAIWDKKGVEFRNQDLNDFVVKLETLFGTAD